jgi:hypothetical protein
MPPIYEMASRLSEGDRSLNLSATPICVRCYKRGCRNRSDAHRSRPQSALSDDVDGDQRDLAQAHPHQFIAQPLMVPFTMIMADTLGYGPSNMALAEWNHPNEAFLCDGTDQAFGGSASRQPGLVRKRTRVAPESSAFAATSVRIVCSRVPVYASRRSSRRFVNRDFLGEFGEPPLRAPASAPAFRRTHMRTTAKRDS